MRSNRRKRDADRRGNAKSSDKLRRAAITILPLTLTALAFWAAPAGYEAHLFEDLQSAKVGALVAIAAVHLFAPIWAATRDNWWTAGAAQVVLVGVNDLLWLQFILTRAHDAPVPKCGTGAIAFAMATCLAYFVYVPVALFTTYLIDKKRAGDG